MEPTEIAPSEIAPLLKKAKKDNGEKIIRFLQERLHFLVKIFTTGGSLQAGLQVFLESWQYDIQQAAGHKKFDTQTISRIGAYLALMGAMLGYFAYRKLYNAEIREQINYIFYKIMQLIAAWGLQSYLLKLFLFSYTKACTFAFHEGIADYCPNTSEEAVPLNIFCCVDKENTTNFDYPAISLNEIAFMMSAIISMELIRNAFTVFRFEFKKHPVIGILTKLISFLAAGGTYAILKFAIPSELALLWYTAAPLTVYHIAHFLTSIPILITPVDSNIDTDTHNNYRNGFWAAFFSSFGGAALLHAVAYSAQSAYVNQLNNSSTPVLRYVIEIYSAAILGISVGYQTKNSRDFRDFFNRILANFLPKPWLKKINRLPAKLMPTSVNGEIQIQNISTKKSVAIILASSLTSAIAGTSFHFMINAIPTGTSDEMLQSWQALALRFGLAATGGMIYGCSTYGRKINIANDLKVSWPSSSDALTFLLLTILTSLSIVNEKGGYQIGSFIFALLLLSLCAFGNTSIRSTKKLLNYLFTSDKQQSTESDEQKNNTIRENDTKQKIEEDRTAPQRDEIVEVEEQNDLLQHRSSPPPRNWFNNWCCFNRAATSSKDMITVDVAFKKRESPPPP